MELVSTVRKHSSPDALRLSLDFPLSRFEGCLLPIGPLHEAMPSLTAAASHSHEASIATVIRAEVRAGERQSLPQDGTSSTRSFGLHMLSPTQATVQATRYLA